MYTPDWRQVQPSRHASGQNSVTHLQRLTGGVRCVVRTLSVPTSTVSGLLDSTCHRKRKSLNLQTIAVKDPEHRNTVVC